MNPENCAPLRAPDQNSLIIESESPLKLQFFENIFDQRRQDCPLFQKCAILPMLIKNLIIIDTKSPLKFLFHEKIFDQGSTIEHNFLDSFSVRLRGPKLSDFCKKCTPKNQI